MNTRLRVRDLADFPPSPQLRQVSLLLLRAGVDAMAESEAGEAGRAVVTELKVRLGMAIASGAAPLELASLVELRASLAQQFSSGQEGHRLRGVPAFLREQLDLLAR